MLYEEQLKREEKNKQIFNNIISTVPGEIFIEFYKTHNQKETLKEYNIPTVKLLTKILKEFNYDFSFKKCLNRGKPAVRSHESYIQGGIKSALTQKQNWKNKSEEEKNQWAIKQSLAHLNSPTFKEKITQSNIAYINSLSSEQREAMNKARSESMKTWWANLSEEEKETILDNRFKSGYSYHMKDSLPNLNFSKKLTQLNIEFEREFCLNHKFFDFKVNNILIEIDPTFTHNITFNPFEHDPLSKNYHKDKSELALKNNYRCIHIFDWDDQDKILKNLILPKEKLMARKCILKEVSKQEAIDFIELNHLQGYAKDQIRLGLYYNDQLVSIMTFGKPRYNKNYQYELIRYCSSKTIIGGAEKLFSYFVKTYNPTSVISYCDTSKFVGNVYTNLGFTLLRKPQPSKHWYNIKTKEHYLDSLIRRQGFSRIINHCDASKDNLTTSDNRELMINSGFVEIYDCGQSSYTWKKEQHQND